MSLPGTHEQHRPHQLHLFHRNARQGNVTAIAGSLRALDQYRPVVVNRGTHTGRPLEVLAGNHTVQAFRQLGEQYPSDDRWQLIDCWVIDVDDDAAQRVVLADNRTAELGGYDERMLLELVGSVNEGPGLEGTGYDQGDLERLAALVDELPDLPRDDSPPGPGQPDSREEDEHDDSSSAGADPDDEVEVGLLPTGDLLRVVDVTVAEPTRIPDHGSTWQLGRHTLVVAKLAREHHLWSGWLPERVFLPYPEPYVTTSEIARTEHLLLVQPNRYLAGHLLDKHASAFPNEPVLEIDRPEPIGLSS